MLPPTPGCLKQGFENKDGEEDQGDITLSHDLELILHISSISLGLSLTVPVVTKKYTRTTEW